MRTLLAILLFLNASMTVPVAAADVARENHGRVAPQDHWSQRFADSQGVKIEYRVREAGSTGNGLAPVVFIPGMANSASVWEDNADLVRALDVAGSRKLVAISLRGRGASECPDKGWTPEDHHSDIAAVIGAEQLENYHLVAHSMGVAYGIGFALSRPPGEIRSFIVGDYFPAVKQVSEDWARMLESAEPPLRYDPRMARHILREQGSQDYADRLSELTMPMQLIFGRKSMEAGVEQQYAKAPHHRVLWIDHGHTVFANAEAIAATAAHIKAADERRFTQNHPRN